MNRRGFTVLETFVVVAIIAAMIVLLVLFIQETQKRSRDATRISSVREISKALALFQTTSFFYPIAPTDIRLTGDDAVSLALKKAGAIPSVPRDPLHPDLDYLYGTDSRGSVYHITFCLETDSIPHYTRGCENTLTP
jgi:type II secretory pathway pseudopilin PulG